MEGRPKSSVGGIANLMLNFNQSSKLSGLEDSLNKVKDNQQQIDNALGQIKEAQAELSRLQSQTLEIQKQAYLQQQIQTRIQVQEALTRQKQKDLKNTIFEVNNSIDNVLESTDSISRLILLEMISESLSDNQGVTQELEEIVDKEYAKNISKRLTNTITEIRSNLKDEELLDLNILMNVKPEIDQLKIELEEGVLYENDKLKEIEEIKLPLIEKRGKSSKPKRQFSLKKQLLFFISLFLLLIVLAVTSPDDTEPSSLVLIIFGIILVILALLFFSILITVVRLLVSRKARKPKKEMAKELVIPEEMQEKIETAEREMREIRLSNANLHEQIDLDVCKLKDFFIRHPDLSFLETLEESEENLNN